MEENSNNILHQVIDKKGILRLVMDDQDNKNALSEIIGSSDAAEIEVALINRYLASLLRNKTLVGISLKETDFGSPKVNQQFKQQTEPNFKKKNFARKYIEQQATKEFIKKDNKPAGKSKLKLKI